MSDTEGESFLADFFEEKDIQYESQKKIEGLKGDFADYRVADFYLPQYDVYVEFLGKWQSEIGQKKYKQKMAIYHKNNIPCVYIFPDNLGTIDWVFRNRLRKVLVEKNNLPKLIKYEIKNFKEKYVWVIILLFGILIIDPSILSFLFFFILLFWMVFFHIREFRNKILKK